MLDVVANYRADVRETEASDPCSGVSGFQLRLLPFKELVPGFIVSNEVSSFALDNLRHLLLYFFHEQGQVCDSAELFHGNQSVVEYSLLILEAVLSFLLPNAKLKHRTQL